MRAGLSDRLRIADGRRYPRQRMPRRQYKLPEMNGLDLLVELPRRKIDLPAILITAHPNAAVRDLAARAGVHLIEKPLLNDMLFQSIRPWRARRFLVGGRTP